MRTRHLLTALVATSVILAACGSDDDSSDSATTDAAAAPEATTADTEAASTPAATEAPGATTGDATAAEATVMVSSDPALGDYLVDGTGMTLYLFTKDEGTTTACSGDCAANWPPIVASDPTGGDGIDAALLGTSADGIEANQVTYNGHLLYYFANDTAPGDTNGVGLPNWFAVDPAGEAIEAS